jgi:hypothetical protein
MVQAELAIVAEHGQRRGDLHLGAAGGASLLLFAGVRDLVTVRLRPAHGTDHLAHHGLVGRRRGGASEQQQQAGGHHTVCKQGHSDVPLSAHHRFDLPD